MKQSDNNLQQNTGILSAKMKKRWSINAPFFFLILNITTNPSIRCTWWICPQIWSPSTSWNGVIHPGFWWMFPHNLASCRVDIAWGEPPLTIGRCFVPSIGTTERHTQGQTVAPCCQWVDGEFRIPNPIINHYNDCVSWVVDPEKAYYTIDLRFWQRW